MEKRLRDYFLRIAPNTVLRSYQAITACLFTGLLLGCTTVSLYSQSITQDYLKDNQGAIIRSNRTEGRIRLLFTGHEFADGAKTILETLEAQKVRGYFFFTGDFVRRFSGLTRKIYKAGHYVGPHSDKHLQYCDWNNRDLLLVQKEVFLEDLEANYRALEKVGIPKSDTLLFVAPYEWYNTKITSWCTELGIQLINFTPRTGTNADYTYPEMANYKSSEQLLQELLVRERQEADWLRGAHLLIHIGTDPRRKDKFYARLAELIETLKSRGYIF